MFLFRWTAKKKTIHSCFNLVVVNGKLIRKKLLCCFWCIFVLWEKKSTKLKP